MTTKTKTTTPRPARIKTDKPVEHATFNAGTSPVDVPDVATFNAATDADKAGDIR